QGAPAGGKIEDVMAWFGLAHEQVVATFDRLVDWLRRGAATGQMLHVAGLTKQEEQAAGPEPIVPDTNTALSWTEMAEAFDKLGTPTIQEEVELAVDPDDYPLF